MKWSCVSQGILWMHVYSADVRLGVVSGKHLSNPHNLEPATTGNLRFPERRNLWHCRFYETILQFTSVPFSVIRWTFVQVH